MIIRILAHLLLLEAAVLAFALGVDALRYWWRKNIPRIYRRRHNQLVTFHH